MFVENQKRYIRYSKKSLLCLLLLVCGDISPNPGPQPSPSLKRFTRKRGFKILHQNINGISEKIDSVRGILQHKNIQIFAFTEIHLNASVRDAKIFVDGYKIERLDRKNGTNGTHGGAICFIRSDVNYERKNLEIKRIEAIWIGVSFTKANPILICFMYRSPDSSEYLDENFLTYFDNMIETVDYENKETILTGNLNCNYLVHNDHKEIKEILYRSKIEQLIKQPTIITETSKILINIICTNNERAASDTIVEPSAISDHNLIGINRKMNCQKYIARKLFTRDYKNYDENAFRRELSLTDWNLLFFNNDFNLSWNAFKDKLRQLINVHAPLTEKIVRGKRAPWLTIDIKVAINDKDHYLKVARRANNKADWQLYRKSRNYVTYAIHKSKANYCKNLLTETSQKTKDFWKNIKKFFPTKQKPDLPLMMIIDAKKTFGKQTIANCFCMFFITIGNKLQDQVISLQNRIWKSYENKNMRNYMKVNSTFIFQPTNRQSV